MEFITMEEVEKRAKPGDKLQGILYQYPTGLPDSKTRVNELIFWDCIGCLTGKGDVIEGADYYLQKQADGSFIKYGIIREVNHCTKVPKEFIEHIVQRYLELETRKIPANICRWKKEELVNCYYEQEADIMTRHRYVCCVNNSGDAWLDEFYTTTAVWAYLCTDMDIDDIHTLDTIVSNKDSYIRVLKDLIENYKKKIKEVKKK